MLRGHIRSLLPLAAAGLHLLACGGGDASSPENSPSTGGNVATGGIGGTGPGTGGTTGGTGGVNPGTGGVTTGGTGGIAMTGGTGGTPAPGAPVVAQLTTNVPSITEGQSVTFNALVTDPDGAADIIGGTLKDASGALTYGSFVQQAAGSFTLTLDWAAISAVVPIEFVGQEVRTFRAQFLDQATHTGEASTDLTLSCAANAACNGSCVDLNVDGSHCGSCGKTCSTNVYGGCVSGACAPDFAGCFVQGNGFATCDAYCASIGRTCVQNGCGEATTAVYAGIDSCNFGFGGFVAGGEGCSDVITWDTSGEAERCCCSGSP